jgi:hypothetical protein
VAVANSEREANGVRVAPQTKGKVGAFELPSLRDDIANSIKDVKVGGISEPLRGNDGYQIFRVDDRTAASTTAMFNENQVREAITMERATKQREDYLQNLRNEAYLKIAENYRQAVAPLLKLDPQKMADNADVQTGSAKPAEKKKGKLLGIFPKP